MTTNKQRGARGENRVAKMLRCKGRVHSEASHSKGYKDLDCEGMAVEVKTRLEAVPKTVQKYIDQAIRNAGPDELPFVVAHTPNTDWDKSIVYIRFDHFIDVLRSAGLIREDDDEAIQ